MTSTEVATAPAPAETENQTKPEQESPAADTTETTADAKDGKTEDKAKDGSAPTSPAKAKPTTHKVDYKQDRVYVYQYVRCPALPSASPFCLKVETFLRMAEIDYENVEHKMKYKSKKGQLPFVELNGEEVSDSEIIIRKLSEHFKKDLDEDLSAEQKILSHAFVSMLDTRTSWVPRCWRFKNPAEFMRVSKLDPKSTINSKLPTPISNFLYKVGLKNNFKQTIMHGMGRNTTEEIYDFGKQDLKALSGQLGEQTYFFGEKPHLLDCAAFAHLCQFIYIPFGGFDEWIEKEAPNLKKFCETMKEKYWSDWEQACSTLELNTHIPKTESEIEEAKKQEEAKQEELKRKEEAKKAKEEAKAAKKAKKEQKAKEAKEAKEKAAKEKAEKEAKEKEAKEKEAKEKKEAEAAAAAAAKTEEKTEGAPAAEEKKADDKPAEAETKSDDKPAEASAPEGTKE